MQCAPNCGRWALLFAMGFVLAGVGQSGSLSTHGPIRSSGALTGPLAPLPPCGTCLDEENIGSYPFTKYSWTCDPTGVHQEVWAQRRYRQACSNAFTAGLASRSSWEAAL